MSEILPMDNLLPDFLSNNVITKSMGDILPKHLREEVTAISTTKQQAKFLLDRMLPDMSKSDVNNFLNVMDKYSRYERNSIAQMELIFDNVRSYNLVNTSYILSL